MPLSKNAEGARHKETDMKYILIILALLYSSFTEAQSKKTSKVLAHAKILVKAIFETKDSATLQSLFAPGMKHKTGDGIIESREEAIRNIASNKSVYVQAEMLKGYGVTEDKDSTTVRYFYRGRENKPDGSSSIYTANLVMVWVMQKKEPKLARLETIKID